MKNEMEWQCIYGKDFSGKPSSFHEITCGEAVIQGRVKEIRAKTLRGDKTLLWFSVSDEKGHSFPGQMIIAAHLSDELMVYLKQDDNLFRFCGLVSMNQFTKELALLSVVGIKRRKGNEG